MDESMLERIGRTLPIFPLPNVVLMPGALLPLHVFEPRYRALVAHVREHEGVLGIATLQPGHEAEYEGAPPIHPEIGVGVIVAHQPLPDGRCNIVLQHLHAALVEAELPPGAVGGQPEPFRRVQARMLPYDPTGAEVAIRNLQLMVLQLGGLSPEAGAEARRLVDLEPTELVDSLARKLLQDDVAQRAYLAAPTARQRIAMVADRLADFMAMASPTARA